MAEEPPEARAVDLGQKAGRIAAEIREGGTEVAALIGL